MSIYTNLEVLRKSNGWQDAGQTGEDETLKAETVVEVHDDGSVSTPTGGYLVSQFDVDQEWIDFLVDNELIDTDQF